MSEGEAAIYARKVKRAAQLLLFQRHTMPGVKGWELRRALGKDYMKVLDLLSAEFDKLGLTVKALSESGKSLEKLGEGELDKATFFVTLKEPVGKLEATAGFRIDDIAMLAATVAYIVSRHGKAPRKEVEELLAEKFPRWRIELGLDRFVRRGYLVEDGGVLSLSWRSRVEIDSKALLSLILSISNEI